MAQTHKTREAWLVAGIAKLAPLFKTAGADIPQVRVSVGWPSGKRSGKNVAIGECWKPFTAADGVSQIFISPVLDDPSRVLDVLAHELVHAVDKGEHGHTGPFAKLAKAIGLTGQMTATVASDELKAKLAVIVDKLGPYPHAKLTSANGGKKQSTRMIKCECVDCEYICRTTRTNIDRLGAPVCPGCDQRMSHDSY